MPMVKLQFKWTSKRKTTGSYSVTIPKILVEKVLGWKAGDELEISYKEIEGKKGVFITKKG